MKPADTAPAYDLVVAGGGVTGAGVFHRAAAMGYRVLLVDKNDFSWGTSSRSSKMVHGGLRYLAQGRFWLTRSAVKERERLLAEYPGLVTPLKFLLPIYRGQGPSRTTMAAGLSIYSFLAGHKQHQVFSRDQALALAPMLNPAALASAVGFKDAQVDDARLVLRLLFDGADMGGHALNYTAVKGIQRDRRGRVRRVILEDRDTGEQQEIRTRVLVNATGAFAEQLHPSPSKHLHVRPLRGSHIIFPGDLIPLDRVISFIHPRDKRPVFLFPWQGALVLGTTDTDHEKKLALEPGMSRQEADYLLEGAALVFPGLGLDLEKAVSSIAGIRPVLSRGKKEASGESREHVIWKDKGLITVTGGKLTTFALLARDALRAAGPWLPDPSCPRSGGQARIGSEAAPDLESAVKNLEHLGCSPATCLTLAGRLGSRLPELAGLLSSENCRTIPGTQTLWAELCHSAAQEQVRHLSDLLLRRVRIGLLLPFGGRDMMDEIRHHTAPFLDWDAPRWEKEMAAYHQLWEQAHSPGPGRS